MNYYLIFIYLVLAAVCVFGSFSRSFNGDTLQRIALGGLFFCFIYRAHMLTYVNYSWPHEPPLITFLLVFASGTIKKTVQHCLRRRRFQKLMKIRGGQK